MLGLAHGRDHVSERGTQQEIYLMSGEFAQRFEDVNGALRCRDLIGLDVTTAEGVQEYYARNLLEEVCSGVVTNSVRVLLDILED
jgi:hypothetical protein